MQTKLQDSRQRSFCPRCGWVYYKQLKVGAAALIEKNGRLLLLKRSRQPWQGCWNLPAGYVEVDETPAAAAEREVLEECGLDVRATELQAALFFADDPRGNGLLLVYHAEVSGGELHTSPEVTETGWFSPDEIPVNLAGAGHRETIQRWKTGQMSHG